MKANEFVKTHGVETTQDIVKYYGNHTHVTDDARMFTTEEFYKRTRVDYVDDLNSMVKMVDLKRIVKSHEIVNSYGGLIEATRLSKQLYREISTPETHMILCSAIADVESCL